MFSGYLGARCGAARRGSTDRQCGSAGHHVTFTHRGLYLNLTHFRRFVAFIQPWKYLYVFKLRTNSQLTGFILHSHQAGKFRSCQPSIP